jgi:hypothetical protein
MTTRRAFLRATTGRGEAEIRTVGRPDLKMNHYAVNKKGKWAGAATWAGARFAVSVDGESRLEDSAYLYERS